MELHPFKALYPNPEKIIAAPSFFRDVKYSYDDYRGRSFFEKQVEEALYIQQIIKGEKSYSCIVGCIDIEDFIQGRIRKHENIISNKEDKQIDLLKRRSAIVKPVVLTYPKVVKITDWIEEYIQSNPPLFNLKISDQEYHRLWVVRHNEVTDQLKKGFQEECTDIYIADGHHRTSASAHLFDQQAEKGKLNKYRYIPSAFFSFDQLDIFDFNRVFPLKDKEALQVLLEKLKNICVVEPMEKARKPRQKHEMTMFMQGQWYSLKWRDTLIPARLNGLLGLDVYLLNLHIKKHILENSDLVVHEEDYVEGPKGVEGIMNKLKKMEHGAAFCLYPVSMEDIKAIADAGGVLPPKSTWFEPRMVNGLLVKEL